MNSMDYFLSSQFYKLITFQISSLPGFSLVYFLCNISSTPLSLNKFLIEKKEREKKEAKRKCIEANLSSGNDQESSKRDH